MLNLFTQALKLPLHLPHVVPNAVTKEKRHLRLLSFAVAVAVACCLFSMLSKSTNNCFTSLVFQKHTCLSNPFVFRSEFDNMKKKRLLKVRYPSSV